MSRDRTPDEIIEDALFRPRRDLEEMEQRFYILYKAAREEGMVVGIRAALTRATTPLGSRECPFCLESVVDLLDHVRHCSSAPEVQETVTEGQRDTAEPTDTPHCLDCMGDAFTCCHPSHKEATDGG